MLITSLYSGLLRVSYRLGYAYAEDAIRHESYPTFAGLMLKPPCHNHYRGADHVTTAGGGQIRPPYQPLILQNQGKTEVLPVLPTTVPLSCIECIVGFLIVVISFSYQTRKQNCVTEWKNETLHLACRLSNPYYVPGRSNYLPLSIYI